MVGYKTSRYGKIIFVIGLLLIPRIYSLLRPTLWLVEEPLLYRAFLMTKGFSPYTGFALSQFPFLETIFAGSFLLFGITVRTAEIFTQIVILLLSFALFLFVKRSGKETHIALAAAMICACATIVFHYHIFTREYFVALFVVVAAVVTISRTPTRRNAILSGLLLSFAVLSSISAMAFVASHIIYLFFVQKSRKALLILISVLAALSVNILAIYFRFGISALNQLEVIGNIDDFADRWRLYSTAMPLLLLTGTAGIVYDLTRQRSQLMLLPLLHFLSGSLFMIFFHPGMEERTIIEILPWVSLFTGTLFGSIVQALMRIKVDWKPALIDFMFASGLLTACIALNWAFPSTTHSAGIRMQRSEFEARVRVIRQNTDEINFPDLLAIEANRIKGN